ncbi:hypothetical protein LZ023_30580 [Pseudomonas silvicola]|nr:hypothetical protein LZ023_30580 [Pseudomonas silvicola]
MLPLIPDPVPRRAPLPDGLPDLALLPRHDPADPATFISASLAYWQLPIDQHHTTRQLQQEVRLRDNFLEQARLHRLFDGLSEEAYNLARECVRYPRWQDRASGREVYGLHLVDDTGQRTAPLPGLFVLTETPAGVDYSTRQVVARATATGPTLVHCTGTFGFLQGFDHLQQALDTLARRFHDDAMQRCLMLARLSVQDQAQWLKALAAGVPALVAVPLRDNVFSAAVSQQVAAWKSNEEQAQGNLWQALIGLDVSMSRKAQAWKGYSHFRQVIRAQWPAALLADEPALDSLLALQWQRQHQAHEYFGDLPSFHDYARQRISAEVAGVDPTGIGFMIYTAAYAPDPPISELVPATPGRQASHEVSSDYVSLLEYIALRLDRTGLEARRIEPVGLHPAPLSLAQVDQLAQRLKLQEGYEALLQARLARPQAAVARKAYDTARAAAEGLIDGQLRLDARVARAAGHLDEAGLRTVLQVLDHPSAHGRPLLDGHKVQVQGLVMAGNSLRDVFVFNLEGEPSLILYRPGYPGGAAFQRFASVRNMLRKFKADLAGIASPTSSAPARYWLGRFGAHQQGAALRVLSALAGGRGGSDVLMRPLERPLAQVAFDYRSRYLRSDADAQAVSDTEVAVDKGLAIAVALFRIASLVLPGRLMTVLDVAELGFLAFKGYEAYQDDQKQLAAEYTLEALSSAVGLHNAKRPWNARTGTRAPLVRLALPTRAVAGQAPQLQRLLGTQPSAQPFQFKQGPRQGLYVFDGALHARLDDGRYHRVYEVRDPLGGPSTFRLGAGEGPLHASHFSNPDPLLRHEGGGRWRLTPQPSLKGGMDAQQALEEARYVLAGVELDQQAIRDSGEVSYTLRMAGGRLSVKYDLDSHQWYCADNGYYYRLDRDTGQFIASREGTRLADAAEQQRARRALGCPDRPAFSPATRPLGTDVVPAHVHQVWIGDAQTLIDTHQAALVNNMLQLRGRPTAHTVHFLARGGDTHTARQLQVLQQRFKGVAFEALEDDAFFQAFLASPHAEPFNFFLQPGSRNYAAACDVLRYRLMFAKGGVYLDMDDKLLKPLPILRIRPGDVMTGGAVNHVLLGLDAMPNNSHFATLAQNPLLDAISQELLRRFATAREHLAARPFDLAPGMRDYMTRISTTTGPGLFNDVVRLAQPRHAEYWRLRTYVFELYERGVLCEEQVRRTVLTLQAWLAPLEEVVQGGSTHSWLWGR